MPKFRSKFEKNFAKDLKDRKIKYTYETKRIPYVKKSTYTPDFILTNGVIVETKGRFTSADRSKHLRVREQHPDLDIRFVFMNPYVRLSKKSKTTYAEWCDKHNFKWANKVIPEEWIND